MPSADQVKALISSLTEGDEAHFYSIAMQIAAHEARLGHGKLPKRLGLLSTKRSHACICRRRLQFLLRDRAAKSRSY